MTTITMSRVQRDSLRAYITGRASSVAHHVFPQWDDVPEDRETALASVDEARELLILLDRVGWEIAGSAEEYTIELDSRQLELVLSRDEIRQTYEYDHRDDDRAVLDAVESLKAVA
jgi:hypothetical protein